MDRDDDKIQMARICFDGRELRRRSRSRTREPDILDCTSTTMNRTTDFLDAANEEELCLLGFRERPYVIRTTAEKRNLIDQTVAEVAMGAEKAITIDEVDEDLHCFDVLREGRPFMRRRFRFNWKNSKEATISKDILSTLCQRTSTISKVKRAKMDQRDYKIFKSSLALTEEYMKMMQNENCGGNIRHDEKFSTIPTTEMSNDNNTSSHYRKGRVLNDITKKGLSSVSSIQHHTTNAVPNSDSMAIKKHLEADEKPSDLREILAFIDNATDPKESMAVTKIGDKCRTTSTTTTVNDGISFGLGKIKYEVNSQATRNRTIAEVIGLSAGPLATDMVTEKPCNVSNLSSDDDENDFWGCIDKKFAKTMANNENKAQDEKGIENKNDNAPSYVADKTQTRKVKGKGAVATIGRPKKSQPCLTGSQPVVRRRGRPPKNSNQAVANPLPKSVNVDAISTSHKNMKDAKKEKARSTDSDCGSLFKKKTGPTAKYKKAAKSSTMDHRSKDCRIPIARSCKK